MARRLELVSGLGASGFGILGLIYAIFGPAYHSVGTAISVGPTVGGDGKVTTVSGWTSLAQRGLDPAAIVFFAVVVLILVGFAPGRTGTASGATGRR